MVHTIAAKSIRLIERAFRNGGYLQLRIHVFNKADAWLCVAPAKKDMVCDTDDGAYQPLRFDMLLVWIILQFIFGV